VRNSRRYKQEETKWWEVFGCLAPDCCCAFVPIFFALIAGLVLLSALLFGWL
jgi:hypothetical protein